jgi:NADPH:quinone reductase-like Zn-dependent oxidoreductase
MKAAILYQFGTSPVYGDFVEPTATPGQQMVTVNAASIKNIDKGIASGAHYSSHKKLPAITGIDGVGTLENGQRVYAGSQSGFMAEKTLISERNYVPIPDQLDDVTAAALPNPALSAWFALHYRAAIQPGDTVFINGATGVTGKLAIQLAKYLGAGKVIASGRNPEILESLYELGADEIISLTKDDDDFNASVAKAFKEKPFDIVVDYLWGKPAEILLHVLSGNDLEAVAHRTRYVTVGEMAGPTINLSSAALRSAAIEIYGVGGGSIPKEIMQKVPGEILPLLFGLAASGDLKIQTEVMSLKDVASAWSLKSAGKRLVLVP